MMRPLQSMHALPVVAGLTSLLAFLPSAILRAQAPRPRVEATVFATGFYPLVLLRREPFSEPIEQTPGFGAGAQLSWRFARSWVVQGSYTSVRSEVEGIGDDDETATGSMTYTNLRIVRASPFSRLHWLFGAGVVSRGGDAWEGIGGTTPARRRAVVLGMGGRIATPWGVPLEIGVEVNSYQLRVPELSGGTTKSFHHELMLGIGLPIPIYRGAAGG